MPLDALTLISKVIERAAEKSGRLGASAGLVLDDTQKMEMLVETLASQLLEFFGFGTGAAGAAAGTASSTDLQRICDDQILRNRSLARALGACDCWGELPACDLCGGRGAPGWRPPDRARFDTFVRPVIQRMKRHRLTVDAAPGVRSPRMPY